MSSSNSSDMHQLDDKAFDTTRAMLMILLFSIVPLMFILRTCVEYGCCASTANVDRPSYVETEDSSSCSVYVISEDDLRVQSFFLSTLCVSH